MEESSAHVKIEIRVHINSSIDYSQNKFSSLSIAKKTTNDDTTNMASQQNLNTTQP